jgi:hypothetical protein
VGTVNRAMANGRRLSAYDMWLPEVYYDLLLTCWRWWGY